MPIVGSSHHCGRIVHVSVPPGAIANPGPPVPVVLLAGYVAEAPPGWLSDGVWNAGEHCAFPRFEAEALIGAGLARPEESAAP